MTGELEPSDEEAEAEYPHRLVRWVAFIVAALLGVGSWTSRQSDPGYASLMLACAVLLLLVAITLPRLTKVSVSPTRGPSLELDPRRGAERRASAKAADAAVTSDEVAKEIEDPETKLSVWKRAQAAAIRNGGATQRREARERAAALTLEARPAAGR